jgi:hypothetical protein
MVALRLINYVMPQHLISYRPGRDSASDFTTVDARSEHAILLELKSTKQTVIRSRLALDSVDLFRRRLAYVEMGRERKGGDNKSKGKRSKNPMRVSDVDDGATRISGWFKPGQTDAHPPMRTVPLFLSRWGPLTLQ